MSQPSEPCLVKLICGMIASDAGLFAPAIKALKGEFGAVDLVSEVTAFDFTHYYDEEMGAPLWRQFVAFATLVRPDVLAGAKVTTNRLEEEFAGRGEGQGERGGDAESFAKRTSRPCRDDAMLNRAGQGETKGSRVKRPINLDVGYIEDSKLVLASMKNFSHRIYLHSGVYAEVTLMYHRDGWQAFAWTFPDYASGRYRAFLDQARGRLREDSPQRHKDMKF